MDYDKLIEDLRVACAGNQYNIIGVAATAIETLLVENQALRNAANGFKADLARVTAERDAAEGEVKHLKAVLREKWIMTIPPRYPWGRPEWNE